MRAVPGGAAPTTARRSTRSRERGARRKGPLRPRRCTPSPISHAHVVCGCRDRGLAFKATAGLHHPLRDGLACTRTLNLLGAAVLAHAAGAEERDLVAVLAGGGPERVRRRRGGRSSCRGREFGADAGRRHARAAVHGLRELLVLGAGRGPAGPADPLTRRREFLAGAAGLALGIDVLARRAARAGAGRRVVLRRAAAGRRQRACSCRPASARAGSIATTGVVVPGTTYTWHAAPDGQAPASRRQAAAGFYVSNCEWVIPGGTGMVRGGVRRHQGPSSVPVGS